MTIIPTEVDLSLVRPGGSAELTAQLLAMFGMNDVPFVTTLLWRWKSSD